VTRTAIGLGLGLLVADKIRPSIRQAAAITLVAIGALAGDAVAGENDRRPD